MDAYNFSMDIRRYGLISAVNAEIEGMKAENMARETNGQALAYNYEDFSSKADELRNLAYCDNTEL